MKVNFVSAFFVLTAGLAFSSPAFTKAVDGQPARQGVAASSDAQEAWFFYTCTFTYKETIGSYGGVGGGGGGTMTRTKTGYYPSMIPCSV
jgi:hypothetical protein